MPYMFQHMARRKARLLREAADIFDEYENRWRDTDYGRAAQLARELAARYDKDAVPIPTKTT